MEVCAAEEIFRNSGEIKLVSELKFEIPADFNFVGSIANMRDKKSMIWMEDIEDCLIMKARNKLVPGESYFLGIYSARSVTTMACYNWLKKRKMLFTGGMGLAVSWSLLKKELLEAVGPERDGSISTSVVSFSDYGSPLELWRYNLGEDSFWEMRQGIFDDDGFYMDAYLLGFTRAR